MTTIDSIRDILASILKLKPELLRTDSHVMDELGADSLQFLDYVAMVEKTYGIALSGSDSEKLSTIEKAAAFVESRVPIPDEAGERDKQPDSPVIAKVTSGDLDHAGTEGSAMWLDDNGNLHSPVEVGMPLTGRNNLGETPLLKLVGDLRWKHVEMFSGVPSKELCDDTGERLYATFFYVEAHFPEFAPMAAYGENDRIHIVSSIRSSGGSVLDGFHWLVRNPESPLTLDENSPAHGIPYIRTSNIFVKMLQGAEWLKRSKPCQPGFQSVPASTSPPSTAEICRIADERGQFEDAPEDWIVLNREPVHCHYDIVPDRDLNGAGLLYFANYSQILDICEREILGTKLPILFEESVIDNRTTIRRQMAFLSNASQSDQIKVSATVAVENPFRTDSPEEQDIHLWMNFLMERCSDDRRMLVCTVRKTISNKTWGSADTLPTLRELKNHQ